MSVLPIVDHTHTLTGPHILTTHNPRANQSKINDRKQSRDSPLVVQPFTRYAAGKGRREVGGELMSSMN